MLQLRYAMVLVMALAACGDNQEPAEADALWARIHEENYRGFARAPGYEQRQPSNTASARPPIPLKNGTW